MRQLLRAFRYGVFALGMNTFLAGAAHSQNAPTPPAFDYTGSLFGYYQINEPAPEGALFPVRLFLERRGQHPDRLLVGMGDNFGPEFRASIQPPTIAGRPECRVPPYAGYYPSAIYKSEDRYPPVDYVDCDNVAKFMLAARYDALVPGREDFLYSATWLRRIAVGFQQYPNASSHPLILAANLRINWTVEGAALDAYTALKSSCPLFLAHDNKLFSNEVSCSPGASVAPDTLSTIEKHGQSIGNPSIKESLTSDQVTQVDQQDIESLSLFLSEQKDVGYTIVDRMGIRSLVIGVVGPETMSAVSPNNLYVCSNPMAKGDNVRSATLDRCGSRSQHFESGKGRLVGNVKVLDPLQTVVAILRGFDGLSAGAGIAPFDRVVLMAQMPRTEAEEMAAELRKQLQRYKVQAAPILVLSEAQQDHASPYLSLDYDRQNLIPVLTPHPAYNNADHQLDNPVSTASIGFFPKGGQDNPEATAHLSNQPFLVPLVNGLGKGPPSTTQGLLLERLALLNSDAANTLFNPVTPKCNTDPHLQSSSADREECKAALSQFLLRRIQVESRADAVFLEHRDIFFEPLPAGYDDYTMCPAKFQSDPSAGFVPDPRCALGVALDRVLWKGDMEQRAMIAGKDIVSMLKTAKQLSDSEKNLAAKDVSGQWLTTFGIVKPGAPPTPSAGVNATKAPDSRTFSIPVDSTCTVAPGAGSPDSSYCINGTPIVSDAAYSIATSDNIVADAAIYKVLQSSVPDYVRHPDYFLTTLIAESLFMQPDTQVVSGTKQKSLLLTAEAQQQSRPLYHVDFAKVVAGYSNRAPEGGNSYVAANFQGAANSAASTPSQSELDLESQSRFSIDLPIHLRSIDKVLPRGIKLTSFGVQDDFEYDHSTTGNITGKPVNGIYALDSFSVGGFLQFRLWDVRWKGMLPYLSVPSASKSLPRALLVIAPRQFQTQVNGGYLFFSYSGSNCSLTTSPCEYTLHLPKTNSYFDRVGLRLESGGGPWWKVDRGSYAEVGFEAGSQQSVLSGLTLISNGIPYTCEANTGVSISQCFTNYGKINKNFTIDVNTQAVLPIPTTRLNLEGGYWDIHLQKGLLKTADKSGPGINVTVDTKGDWFSPKSAGRTLSTAQVYAIPLAAAINFPIFRNFSLSPTYSVFLYQAQVTGAKLQTNTFSIAAKWYFAHDASVPPSRQLVFQGPASSDQTKTAKMK